MCSEVAEAAVTAIAGMRRNIRLIQEWTSGKSLSDIGSDDKTRYAVERAFIALAAALQDIPEEFVTVHGLPASGIIGFRNILAHTYMNILDERLMLTIRDDLPALDRTLEELQRKTLGRD